MDEVKIKPTILKTNPISSPVPDRLPDYKTEHFINDKNELDLKLVPRYDDDAKEIYPIPKDVSNLNLHEENTWWESMDNPKLRVKPFYSVLQGNWKPIIHEEPNSLLADNPRYAGLDNLSYGGVKVKALRSIIHSNNFFEGLDFETQYASILEGNHIFDTSIIRGSYLKNSNIKFTQSYSGGSIQDSNIESSILEPKDNFKGVNAYNSKLDDGAIRSGYSFENFDFSNKEHMEALNKKTNVLKKPDDEYEIYNIKFDDNGVATGKYEYAGSHHNSDEIKLYYNPSKGGKIDHFIKVRKGETPESVHAKIQKNVDINFKFLDKISNIVSDFGGSLKKNSLNIKHYLDDNYDLKNPKHIAENFNSLQDVENLKFDDSYLNLIIPNRQVAVSRDRLNVSLGKTGKFYINGSPKENSYVDVLKAIASTTPVKEYNTTHKWLKADVLTSGTFEELNDAQKKIVKLSISNITDENWRYINPNISDEDFNKMLGKGVKFIFNPNKKLPEDLNWESTGIKGLNGRDERFSSLLHEKGTSIKDLSGGENNASYGHGNYWSYKFNVAADYDRNVVDGEKTDAIMVNSYPVKSRVSVDNGNGTTKVKTYGNSDSGVSTNNIPNLPKNWNDTSWENKYSQRIVTPAGTNGKGHGWVHPYNGGQEAIFLITRTGGSIVDFNKGTEGIHYFVANKDKKNASDTETFENHINSNTKPIIDAYREYTNNSEIQQETPVNTGDLTDSIFKVDGPIKINKGSFYYNPKTNETVIPSIKRGEWTFSKKFNALINDNEKYINIKGRVLTNNDYDDFRKKYPSVFIKSQDTTEINSSTTLDRALPASFNIRKEASPFEFSYHPSNSTYNNKPNKVFYHNKETYFYYNKGNIQGLIKVSSPKNVVVMDPKEREHILANGLQIFNPEHVMNEMRSKKNRESWINNGISLAEYNSKNNIQTPPIKTNNQNTVAKNPLSTSHHPYVVDEQNGVIKNTELNINYSMSSTRLENNHNIHVINNLALRYDKATNTLIDITPTLVPSMFKKNPDGTHDRSKLIKSGLEYSYKRKL